MQSKISLISKTKLSGFSMIFPQYYMKLKEGTDPTGEAQCWGTVTPHKRLPVAPSVAWGTDRRSASSCPRPLGS